MWGGWTTPLVAGLVLASLVGMALAFAGGAVIVAVPLAIVAVVGVGLLDAARRRSQTQHVQQHREQAKAESAEFSERDQQTLPSE